MRSALGCFCFLCVLRSLLAVKARPHIASGTGVRTNLPSGREIILANEEPFPYMERISGQQYSEFRAFGPVGTGQTSTVERW